MKFPATALIAAFASRSDLQNHHQTSEQNGRSLVTLRLALLSDIQAFNNENLPEVVLSRGVEANSMTSSSFSNAAGMSNTNSNLQRDVMQWVQETVGVPPALAAESGPPTNDEINILRQAFAAFYGASRDASAAEQLLTTSIEAWQRQPPDEQVGLYRVRADCYMVRTVSFFDCFEE
jgi:hypothetical protein